jgi:hypothetical protein
MNTFKAGDKVRININYPESDWHDRICTYRYPDTNQQSDVVSHYVSYEEPGKLRAGRWIPTNHIELVEQVQTDEYAGMSLEEQIAELTDDLYQVSRSYDAASKHRDMLQYDLTFFTDTMRDVKETEGWCDDGTNTIIDQLNNGFQTHYIEPYQQEFEVEYEITASVTYSGTQMVMASSQEAANEFFSDDPESYITPEDLATDATKYGGWDHCEVEVI